VGTTKNSCNVGVLSEVDWLLPKYRTRMKIIRMFNRIIKMDENRLMLQGRDGEKRSKILQIDHISLLGHSGLATGN
jgi:hypothetical protein